jgi:hypothetical protein
MPCYPPTNTIPTGYSWAVRDIESMTGPGIVSTTYGPSYTHRPGEETVLRYWYHIIGGGSAPTTVSSGSGGTVPITETDWEAVFWSSPDPAAAFQGAPGQWAAEIWEPVVWDETIDPASDPLSPATTQAVEVENWPYPTEPAEPMLTIADVPHDEVDLSSILDFGSGWLPRNCPSDEQFTILGRPFSISYSMLCTSISTWVHPFFQVAAMMSGIGILLGGIRT